VTYLGDMTTYSDIDVRRDVALPSSSLNYSDNFTAEYNYHLLNSLGFLLNSLGFLLNFRAPLEYTGNMTTFSAIGLQSGVAQIPLTIKAIWQQSIVKGGG